MKAIEVSQFGLTNGMVLKEIAEPTAGAGEVKVRLAAAGINPNETYVMTGTYAFFIPQLPFTPGFDGAGIVEAVGPDVTKFKAGDRVYIAGFGAAKNTGTYAEKVVVSEAACHSLPDNVSFEQGAALGIPGTAAYRALFIRGQIKPEDTVLIHGASGGVGLLAIQMAKSVGAKVIGTASSPEGRASILSHGADFALAHITAANKAELMKLTGDKGVDLIIEFLANVNLQTDLEILAKYGRVVVVGNRGAIEINPRFMMAKDTDIRGMGVPNYTPEEMAQCFNALEKMLSDGSLVPVLGETFALADANRAHEVVMDRKSNGKLIFKISDLA